MFAKNQSIKRQYIGKNIENFMELPNLIDIQLASYEKFLQSEKVRKGEPLEEQGLEEAFRSSFPIDSPNGDMQLSYEYYTLDEDNIKFTEQECKQKGLTYAVPLKARINLIFQETGEIRQKDIYMGDIPLMTDRGTFIINGAERVVVSQIHRSPGVIFCHEKGVFSSRIIPYRGSWLEFEIDQKKELIFTKIDRKKKILGTTFLRALGYDTREKIIDCFYKTLEERFEYIKNNILISDLKNILNLSSIDWNEVKKSSDNSLFYQVCKLYNENYTITDIIKELKI